MMRVLRWLTDYGMLAVLLLLCGYFSYATWTEQNPSGAAAGEALADDVLARYGKDATVLIVTQDTDDERAFAEQIRTRLTSAGITILGNVQGSPADANRAMQKIGKAGTPLTVIACSPIAATWAVFDTKLTQLRVQYPALEKTALAAPRSYQWPSFLTRNNLLNVADQIAVIAIIAIGMTMVIITAGIDLSVGSLIALSAVVTARLIRDAAGAENATALGLAGCSLAALAVCAGVGFFSGTMVTFFRIPPFIVTLSMMLVARGLAFILARGQSISQMPDSFTWLGHGKDLLGLPNAVVLMLGLYVVAHVIMTRMTLGRYLYAIGGNPEAARLSGVPVTRVLLLVYTLCGALAGLGGVITASQLKTGAPATAEMKELYVIAAAVVGGTSLAGGEGKILGTLIGAFVIAVIENGMNLTGVESYTQKVVLGLVILGAVLLDMLKRRGSGMLRRTASQKA
jgi:ribose transport system permease protein